MNRNRPAPLSRKQQPRQAAAPGSIPPAAILALLVALAAPAAAREPRMVEFIDGGPAGSYPTPLIPLPGGVVLFPFESLRPSQTWFSDGTYDGTRQLLDHVGVYPFDSFMPPPVYAAGDFACFVAPVGEEPRFSFTALFRSDGTPAGTFQLSPTRQVYSTGLPQSLGGLGARVLALLRNDPSPSGYELWVTDGTLPGTVAIPVAGPSGRANWAYGFGELGDVAYFAAGSDQSDSGVELWRTDGTPAGTYQLIDIHPGVESSWPNGFCTAGSHMLFFADDGVHGYEPWITDGTAAGTRMLVDLLPGHGGSWSYRQLIQVRAHGGRFYFSAFAGGVGVPLYVSDGTPSGTAVVRDADGVAALSVGAFTSVGDLLFYTATVGASGRELWVTDGTPEGTRLVRELAPGSAGIRSPNVYTSGFGLVGAPLGQLAGRVYFVVDDGEHGEELWSSDGTPEGTTLLRDIAPGSASSHPSYPVAAGGRLYFEADDGVHGSELWTSDGTAEGTQLARDLNPANAGASPVILGALERRLLFTARRAGLGGQVLRAGGAALRAGPIATPWTDLDRFPYDTQFPSAQFRGQILFGVTGSDPAQHGLWRTDGTTEGTYLIARGDTPAGQRPRAFAVLPEGVLYLASNGSYAQLFRTDGAAPTQLTSFTDGILDLIAAGGRAFFRAREAQAHRLWIADANGSDIHRVSNTLSPNTAWGVDGERLFLSGSDESVSMELWTSDGTEAGTRLVRDIAPGASTSWPRAFVSYGGGVLFSANDVSHGSDLWRSDGTPEGTSLVVDLDPGPDDPGVTALGVWNGQALLSGNDGSSETHLWALELATDALTPLTSARYTGQRSFVAFGNVAYFAATDEVFGEQVWVTDGSPAGTRRISSIGPATLGADIREFAIVAPRLYFSADDGLHGRQIWALPLFESADLNCDGVVDFADIDPFVAALVGPAAFEAVAPDCAMELADIDGNGAVTFDDIEPFVACLIAGACE